MSTNIKLSVAVTLLLGSIILMIGILNLFIVHPVPGLVFIILSFFYFPPADKLLKAKFGLLLPFTLKVVLAIIAIWFTLGVSDLGDMMDKLGS
jgi:hypothetical protein